jgi:hypothetical protein
MLGIAIDGGSFEKFTDGRLALASPFGDVERTGSIVLAKLSLLRRSGPGKQAQTSPTAVRRRGCHDRVRIDFSGS